MRQAVANSRISLVGVDPGEATGLFALWSTGDGGWAHAYGVAEEQDGVFQFLDDYTAAHTRVVVEQFVREEGTAGVNDTAKVVIGWVEAWLNLEGLEPPFFQQRTFKNFVSDDRLRALGMWIPGHTARHARDAARHAVTYAVHNMRWMELIRQGWPEPEYDDEEED